MRMINDRRESMARSLLFPFFYGFHGYEMMVTVSPTKDRDKGDDCAVQIKVNGISMLHTHVNPLGKFDFTVKAPELGNLDGQKIMVQLQFGMLGTPLRGTATVEGLMKPLDKPLEAMGDLIEKDVSRLDWEFVFGTTSYVLSYKYKKSRCQLFLNGFPLWEKLFKGFTKSLRRPTPTEPAIVSVSEQGLGEIYCAVLCVKVWLDNGRLVGSAKVNKDTVGEVRCEVASAHDRRFEPLLHPEQAPPPADGRPVPFRRPRKVTHITKERAVRSVAMTAGMSMGHPIDGRMSGLAVNEGFDRASSASSSEQSVPGCGDHTPLASTAGSGAFSPTGSFHTSFAGRGTWVPPPPLTPMPHARGAPLLAHQTMPLPRLADGTYPQQAISRPSAPPMFHHIGDAPDAPGSYVRPTYHAGNDAHSSYTQASVPHVRSVFDGAGAGFEISPHMRYAIDSSDSNAASPTFSQKSSQERSGYGWTGVAHSPHLTRHISGHSSGGDSGGPPHPPTPTTSVPTRLRLGQQDMGGIPAPARLCPTPPFGVCPLTGEVMRDPVTAMDGHTYESAAIKQWFREHNTSPVTCQVLNSQVLVPAHVVRTEIAARYLAPQHSGLGH